MADRLGDPPGDRKSTRLNSSHITNSYAVFCLKKKRSLLLVPGGIQLDRGRERLQEVGLPAGGDRHELHCSLLDRAPFRKFLREFVPHPPGRTFLPISGHGPGASGTRHGRVAGFLDHSFLDVSTEIIPEDLTRYGLAQHLTPAPTRERYLRTCSFGWLRRTCAIPFVFWRRLEARARCVRCPASPSPRLVSHFRCSMRPFSPRQSRATANWTSASPSPRFISARGG